jgi:hypothetical protein
LFFVGVIASVLLKYYGGDFMIDIRVKKIDLCPTNVCKGAQAVYRISFSFAIFFAVHWISQWIPGGERFHSRGFLAKFLCLIGIVILAFLEIPSHVFDVYAEISRYISAIFLLLQMIVMIDFAYRWNEDWAEKGVEREEKKYLVGLVVVSAVAIIASVVFWGYFYSWFGAGDGCSLPKFFISFTLILSVAFTVLSIYVEHGALLPSALLVAYSTYVLYTALISDPSQCNTLHNPHGNSTQLILGIILIGFSVTYSAYSLSTAKGMMGMDSVEDQEERSKLVNEDQPLYDPSLEEGEPSPHEQENHHNSDSEQSTYIRKSNRFFHFTMMMASMYAAMLLTNWAQDIYSEAGALTLGTRNMWINIVSQWVLIAIYMWTLAAPHLFPDREFA